MAGNLKKTSIQSHVWSSTVNGCLLVIATTLIRYHSAHHGQVAAGHTAQSIPRICSLHILIQPGRKCRYTVRPCRPPLCCCWGRVTALQTAQFRCSQAFVDSARIPSCLARVKAHTCTSLLLMFPFSIQAVGSRSPSHAALVLGWLPLDQSRTKLTLNFWIKST